MWALIDEAQIGLKGTVMSDLGKFVHLHVHIVYSMMDSVIQLRSLARKTKALGMGAVALTDHGNLFGAYKFQKACRDEGVKPIIGYEAYVRPIVQKDRTSLQERKLDHLVLLCESMEGYRNLSRLSSLAFIKGHCDTPSIDLELLAQYSKGLIATSACQQGGISRAIKNDNMNDARCQLDTFIEIFGKDRFFLEIMDHGLVNQNKINEGLIELSNECGIGLIATNDCHYLNPQDSDAHDVMLCIQSGKKLNDFNRPRFVSSEFYLKTPEQMIALFGHVRGAIENTVAIAERCQAEIITDQNLYPRFKTPDGTTPIHFLRKLVEKGLSQKYGNLTPQQCNRAEYELSVIESTGAMNYYLLVLDCIQWARQQHIPVGPGRGSSAGSIIAYALGITDLDPLAHGLLFERCFNPEGDSIPRFDIDFCSKGRDRVIDYICNKYGHDCVAQTVSFETINAHNSVREVGNLMAEPQDDLERLANLVPKGSRVTIDRALQDVTELRDLYDSDPHVKDLVNRARGVTGAIRKPFIRETGLIFCDQSLIDLIPLYKEGYENAMIAAQYSSFEIREIGLLQMELLGLKELTIIDQCIKSINARFDLKLKAEDIPLDDEKTYRLLQSGRVLGLFQLDCSGMDKLLVDFHPTRLSDLILLTILYRPISRKYLPELMRLRKEDISIYYDHPDMEPILKETYGLFFYQEQVMRVAQNLAGYTMGESYILCYTMLHKEPEKIARERTKFLTGCKKRQINEEIASRIYDAMEKVEPCVSLKSHAATYSVISVRMAYLKAHYPVDFYASLMTNAIVSDDSKMEMYLQEACEDGINILPSVINTSSGIFTPDGENIRFSR